MVTGRIAVAVALCFAAAGNAGAGSEGEPDDLGPTAVTQRVTTRAAAPPRKLVCKLRPGPGSSRRPRATG